MSVLNGALAIIGVVVMSFSPTANAETYSCSHSSGERIFKEAAKIHILRNSSSIKVHPVVSGVPVAEDYWTYLVVAEKDSAGFRAIRLGESIGSLPSGSDFDVIFGGELYIRFEGGKYRALAVAINSGTAEVVSESLICAIAT